MGCPLGRRSESGNSQVCAHPKRKWIQDTRRGKASQIYSRGRSRQGARCSRFEHGGLQSPTAVRSLWLTLPNNGGGCSIRSKFADYYSEVNEMPIFVELMVVDPLNWLQGSVKSLAVTDLGGYPGSEQRRARLAQPKISWRAPPSVPDPPRSAQRFWRAYSGRHLVP